MKFFLDASGRLFYDIINKMQRKTQREYLKLDPADILNMEVTFMSRVQLFEDETIEAGPDCFIVKKPNGTVKVIAAAA